MIYEIEDKVLKIQALRSDPTEPIVLQITNKEYEELQNEFQPYMMIEMGSHTKTTIAPKIDVKEFIVNGAPVTFQIVHEFS